MSSGKPPARSLARIIGSYREPRSSLASMCSLAGPLNILTYRSTRSRDSYECTSMSHDGSAAVESTAESPAVCARLSPNISLALRFTSDESTLTESRGSALGALVGALLDALAGAFGALCCTTAAGVVALVALVAGTGAAMGCGPRAQPAAAMMTATVTILFTLPDLLKTKSPPKAAISVLQQPLGPMATASSCSCRAHGSWR